MKTRMLLYSFSVTILCISLFIMPATVQGAVTPASGIIKGDNVNLRADPNLDGQVISLIKQGSTVDILEHNGSWYKIQLPDGQNGWIYHRYLRMKPLTITSRDRFSSSYTDELLAFAKSFQEVPYVYGGDSPQGFDCSGFTMYVFAKFGINLPHEADMQSENGVEVAAMEDLKPGDLVFFKTLGSTVINHVGIYLGDNQFINASSGYGAVRIAPLDSGYYYDCYAGGRRLIDDSLGDDGKEPDQPDQSGTYVEKK